MSDPSDRSRLWIITIWLLTIFIGVGLVVGQRVENEVRAAREAAFRAQQQRIADEDREALRQVANWHREHRGKTAEDRRTMPSREDAMALLEKSASPPSTRSATAASTSSRYERLIFTDPKTGAQVRLYLLGQRWLFNGPISRTLAPPRLPTAVATLRLGLIVGIFVIWLALMFFRPSLRPQRQVWANALMALVVIAIVATSLGPGQTPAGSWSLEQASIQFCFIATIVTAYVLVTAHLKVRVDHPVCGRCGYNLTGNQSGVCPECGAPTMPAEGGFT